MNVRKLREPEVLANGITRRTVADHARLLRQIRKASDEAYKLRRMLADEYGETSQRAFDAWMAVGSVLLAAVDESEPRE